MINASNGSYQPSYFYMYIDSDESISTIQNNQQTFTHEYIHFLQDIILPYCIRMNLVNLNNFAYVSKVSLQEKQLIKPFTKWSSEEELTFKQQEYTWGTGQFENSVDKILDIQSNYFTSSYGHNIFKYTLRFKDFEYQIGARDFLEYLAHKIEDKFWNTNAPDLPYKSVDKLFDYLGLSFITTEVRLCIVEYCLYNDNPVHMFMRQFIEQKLIIENKDKFLSYDVCSSFLLQIGWASCGGFSESIFTKTERRLNDFKNRLSAQYQHQQFDSVKLWIENVSDYCKNYLSNQFIISNFFTMEFNDFADAINNIIDAIGIPIIENKQHIFMHMLPPNYDTKQFVQFYILSQFMNSIHFNRSQCPIVEFCTANIATHNKSCTDQLSDIFKTEVLCPYALFLKSYGFHEVEFIIK